MVKKTNNPTAEFATQTGQLPLDSLQLIGVAGTLEAPRALLRRASGRIKTVHVGDRLLQGTVLLINEEVVLLASPVGPQVLRFPAQPASRVAA